MDASVSAIPKVTCQTEACAKHLLAKADSLAGQGDFAGAADLAGLKLELDAKKLGYQDQPVSQLLEYCAAESHEIPLAVMPALQRFLRIPKEYLRLIIANLPAQVKALPADQQIRFITVAVAVMHQESRFNPKSKSSANALGLMQVKLDTAREVSDNPDLTEEELFRPATNIKIGLRYLHQLFCWKNGAEGQYNEDNKTFVFAAYNLGITKIRSETKKAKEAGITLVQQLQKNPANLKYRNQVFYRYRHFQRLFTPEISRALNATSA